MERSSRISQPLQAVENSRQYLLFRTEILQKTVVGCPCRYEAFLLCLTIQFCHSGHPATIQSIRSQQFPEIDRKSLVPSFRILLRQYLVLMVWSSSFALFGYCLCIGLSSHPIQTWAWRFSFCLTFLAYQTVVVVVVVVVIIIIVIIIIIITGCQQYLDGFTWRHDSILNFIAKSLQPVIHSSLFN